MQTHELKTDPEVFDDFIEGRKTFEIRRHKGAKVMITSSGTEGILLKDLSEPEKYVLAFQYGAASRDVEIAELRTEIERLKTVPMRYHRMAFNAQLQDENAQLRQQNTTLLHNLRTARWERSEEDLLAEIEKLRQQLTHTCDWFDAQAKSSSKGNLSAWDLMILREERDAINKVLRELK